MAWYDFYRIFKLAFTQDPVARRTDPRQLTGTGVTSPDAIDLRANDALGQTGGFIRVQNDMVDLTSTSNRQNRYKEYQRLLTVAEIEMAMTVFADEACIAGDTKIATVYNGFQTIEWLKQNKADERFPVYCYDFAKEDYTIGWAFNPRLVKRAPTVRIHLDDGSSQVVTPDHRILRRDGGWQMAGSLRQGDELMPFYRLRANHNLTHVKTHQYPRLFSFQRGWVHERQFVDEWRLGKSLDQYLRINETCRLVAAGLNMDQIMERLKITWPTVKAWLASEGFSLKELQYLGKHYADRRRVIGVEPWHEMDVYDLSVEEHENFCTDSCVMHNCQRDDDGRVFKINCENKDVKEELEFLFFHRSMLNLDQRHMWNMAKRLFIHGDGFYELVINPENPKEGIYKMQELPPETMYRIETTKAKLLEFQQSKEGPDLEALRRAPIMQASDQELQQGTAYRFAPEQIVHLRIGDDRKTFYPYGISLIEPARGPAYQLKMMEDAMVVYRLTRAPERRVFYIDVGQLAGFKAEALMERMKDQFRKKKVVSNRNVASGASAVEERWHAPAQDEDYWLPIRPNSNTRIETLPGAQNLGEIDDTVYFRNKLFTALNFPKNYFSLEDPNATRITLSAQDVKFARMIERLQSHIEDGLYEVADRHLKLRGYPPESYEDLSFKMTPPSDWRELSRQEVLSNRLNNMNSLMGSQMMALFDILTRWGKYTEEEAKEMISRLKVQKLEDLKLQVLAQNPALLGIGVPGQGENEVGTEPGGPGGNLGLPGGPGGGPGGAPGAPGAPAGAPPAGGPPAGGPPGGAAPGGGLPPFPPPPEQEQPNQGGDQEQGPGMMPPAKQAKPLPEPSDEEISKYDLEFQDYDSDQDEEDVDWSEVD